MRQRIGLFILILLLPVVAHGAKIQAVVDRTRTTLASPIRLSVTTPDNRSTVDTSVIADFRVVENGTSSSVQIVNGKMTRERTFNYTLIPLREGRLKIPAMTVTLKDRVQFTQPIEIHVTRNPATSSTDRDMYVIGEISETQPYLGQQIIYTFQLFYSVKIANTNYQPPAFAGFTAKQIGEQQTSQQIRNGRRFQVVTLRYLLFPTRTGALSIEPAVLRCDRVIRNQGRGGFDSFLDDPFFGRSKLETRVLRGDPVNIDVQPLPPLTGSDPFSGLIGQFTIRAALETDQTQVGESVTLSVTVEGQGNIQDADLPAIQVPDAFKQYADQPESDFKLGPEGYVGKKIFRVALVPVSAGDFSVNVAGLTYFNPEKKRYQTLPVPVQALYVKPGEGLSQVPDIVSGDPDDALPRIHKKRVAITGRDILPLKSGLDALAHRFELSTLWFFALLIMPAVVFLGFLGLMRLFRKDQNSTAIMTRKSALEFKTAMKDVGSSAFLSHLYRALVYAIYARAGMPGESLTETEAEALLQNHGVRPDTSARAARLLSRIQSAQFGGGAFERPVGTDLAAETGKLIKELSR